MGSGMKWAAVVGAAAFARPAAALANGAALTPPLGFSNWNVCSRKFRFVFSIRSAPRSGQCVGWACFLCHSDP